MRAPKRISELSFTENLAHQRLYRHATTSADHGTSRVRQVRVGASLERNRERGYTENENWMDSLVSALCSKYLPHMVLFSRAVAIVILSESAALQGPEHVTEWIRHLSMQVVASIQHKPQSSRVSPDFNKSTVQKKLSSKKKHATVNPHSRRCNSDLAIWGPDGQLSPPRPPPFSLSFSFPLAKAVLQALG